MEMSEGAGKKAETKESEATSVQSSGSMLRNMRAYFMRNFSPKKRTTDSYMSMHVKNRGSVEPPGNEAPREGSQSSIGTRTQPTSPPPTPPRPPTPLKPPTPPRPDTAHNDNIDTFPDDPVLLKAHLRDMGIRYHSTQVVNDQLRTELDRFKRPVSREYAEIKGEQGIYRHPPGRVCQDPPLPPRNTRCSVIWYLLGFFCFFLLLASFSCTIFLMHNHFKIYLHFAQDIKHLAQDLNDLTAFSKTEKKSAKRYVDNKIEQITQEQKPLLNTVIANLIRLEDRITEQKPMAKEDHYFYVEGVYGRQVMSFHQGDKEYKRWQRTPWAGGVGGNFSLQQQEYIAPQNGVYLVTGSITGNLHANCNWKLVLNGSMELRQCASGTDSGAFSSEKVCQCTFMIILRKGERISLYTGSYALLESSEQGGASFGAIFINRYTHGVHSYWGEEPSRNYQNLPMLLNRYNVGTAMNRTTKMHDP